MRTTFPVFCCVSTYRVASTTSSRRNVSALRKPVSVRLTAVAWIRTLNFPCKGEELAGVAATFLQQLAADAYPYLTEHVLQHLEPRHGDEGGFEFGLDLILDGLERIRDTTSGRSVER